MKKHAAKRFHNSFLVVMTLALALAQPVFAQDASMEKAIALYNSAKYSEAADQLSACLNEEHDNPLLHYYLANCYAHLNKTDDALREYRITYALQPDSSVGKMALEAREKLEGTSQASSNVTSNGASDVALKLGKAFASEKAPAGGARLLIDSNNARSKKILFIGNVLTTTNQLPLVLAALVLNSNTDTEIRVGEVARDSSTLKTSFNGNEATEIIKKEGPWTDVILQEQSEIPILAPEVMNQYALNFAGANQKAGARTFIIETWCHKGKAGDQPALYEAYKKCASSSGATILPIGEAFELCRRQKPRLNLYTDNRHPSALGTYLGACVVYAGLFHRTPIGLPSDLTLVDPATHQRLSVMKVTQTDALALQTIAYQIVKTPGSAALVSVSPVHTNEKMDADASHKPVTTNVNSTISNTGTSIASSVSSTPKTETYKSGTNNVNTSANKSSKSGTTTVAQSSFDANDTASLPTDCSDFAEKLKLAQAQGVGTKTFSDAFSQIDQQVKAGEQTSALKDKLHSLSTALDAQLAQSKILQTQIPVATPHIRRERSDAQTSTSAPLLASAYDTYMKNVERRVKRAWFPPKGTQSALYTVRFKVHGPGNISDITLTNSGVGTTAGRAVKKAVENAGPFSHLPPGSEDPIDIQLQLETSSTPTQAR